MKAILSQEPSAIVREPQTLFAFQTIKGVLYIAEEDGRFYGLFGKRRFQSHATPEQVAQDFSFGLSDFPGVDASSLHIPRDLKKWQRL